MFCGAPPFFGLQPCGHLRQFHDVVSKKDRLEIFIKRLEAAEAPRSADEALLLLRTTLNEVEDELSGVANNPELWESDGRMYPPNEDSRRKADGPCRRYRSRKHNSILGENGALKIVTLNDEVLLDKAGRDGRSADELEWSSQAEYGGDDLGLLTTGMVMRYSLRVIWKSRSMNSSVS